MIIVTGGAGFIGSNIVRRLNAAGISEIIVVDDLTDGRKIHGLVLSGGNPLIVQSTGGVTQMIPASMVKERKRLGRSLMLSADQLGLTAQQVADVVAYLR